MSQADQITVKIEGMTCDLCESAVAAALRLVPDVTDVEVSYRRGLAQLTAGGKATPDRIQRALQQVGYHAVFDERAMTEPPAVHCDTNADFDLVIIGGGSAAFASAIKAAEGGARVAIAEAGTLGGTCVNVGCVPSKTLIRAAEANHRRTHHGFAGIPSTNGRADWLAVRGQKDELVAELRQAKYWDVLAQYDAISLFEQWATITSGRAVLLADGRTVTAAKMLIATGSSPHVPPIPGLQEAGYLDSTAAMALPLLPESLIVIGGGVVAVEQAQMFARLGVRVTILVRERSGEHGAQLPPLLRAEDLDLGHGLAGYLENEGLEVRVVTFERVERGDTYTVHFSQDGRSDSVTAEQLLVAAGRRPNTASFGLEEAGVTLGKHGEILVNEFLQTSHDDIYAAGDVLGEPMLVYVAAHGGSVAAENALSGNARKYDLTVLPQVIFTDPAVATVGFTEAEARGRGMQPIVSRLGLEHVARSLAARDTRGFVKLVADRETRRIIGAHILAAEAGELITEPVLAIKFGLTIEDLASTFHPYLTLSEGIKLAAQTFDKDVAKLSCCAA